jgi:peptide/nickel transport system permease protein
VNRILWISAGAGRGQGIPSCAILPNDFASDYQGVNGYGFAILVAAGLGFIGGVQRRLLVGVMIGEGRGYLRQAWWMSVFPGMAMFITVLGFNLLGDGLRDLFDPRMRQ